MNKASIAKKALSVLLSVLMMLSCCTTVLPLLADLLGVYVEAATGNVSADHGAAFTAALNAYSTFMAANKTDQAANARFHVAETLLAVVQDLAYTPTSFSSVRVTYEGNATSGDYHYYPTWGDRTAPFMADIREAALAYCSNQTQRQLVNDLIPAAANETDTPQNQKYHTGHGSSTSNVGSGDKWQDYVTLGEISDPTVQVTRTVKQAMYDYSSFSDIVTNMPANVNTSITITYNISLHQTGDRATNVGGSRSAVIEYYYFDSDPSGSYGTTSSTNLKNDLSAFTGQFTSAVIQQDPFTAFANQTQAQTAVDNNDSKYNAFWTNSGRWSKSDNGDILLMNYFGGQYTTVAGESCSSVAYTNAIDTYMAACVDALNYYTVKPYAQALYQYTTDPSTKLDRDALWFVDENDYVFFHDGYDSQNRRVWTYWYVSDHSDPDHPVYTQRTTVKEHDGYTTLSRIQAGNILQQWDGNHQAIGGLIYWHDAIEAIYGESHGTKGYKKLHDVDGYFEEDVLDLVYLLQAYYDWQRVVDDKTYIDDNIDDYQIPRVEDADLTTGTYKFRDNDPTSATYVSDAQIDYWEGYLSGRYHFYTTDDTYAGRLLFYVFGNVNRDTRPDYEYINTARKYLTYEAERRGFVMELAPFVKHFSERIYMNLGSLTVNQLQSYILEDKEIYQSVYNYTFVDSNGNQLVDPNNDNAPITAAYLGYGENTEYGPYNYINVYKKYFNTLNMHEPYSFDSNPLARTDFLSLLGTFNEDVQYYIYRLHSQLAYVLATRVRDAMNVTNDADPNLVITLNNFALIKAAVERVTTFFTSEALAAATYDADNNRTGVRMFDYLKNASNNANYASMYKQNHKDANGYYDDNFVFTYLHLIDITITTDPRNITYSLEEAYNKIMNGTFIQKYNEFVATGGLNDWEQIHYYNTSDGSAGAGYKFSKPEAYLIRLPYAGDLGRGNNTVANDTYTVTNKMVESLVGQLDTFLGSQDMVAILSNFIKDSEDSLIIKDMMLSEYVMKLLGEKLFTDELINTLVELIFPMITKLLEDLWADLDGTDLRVADLHTTSHPNNIFGNPDTGKTPKSVYELANTLGLYIYPDKLAANCLGNSQLSSARARIASCGSASRYHEADLWTNVINANLNEDGKLALDWGINSYVKGENQTYADWFVQRAAKFKIALSSVLNGAGPLLVTIFSGIDYRQDDHGGDINNAVYAGTFGAGLEKIVIEGINGYSRIIVPVLEALGCKSTDIINPSNVSSTLTSTTSIVNAILDPIVNLVLEQVAVAPISTILQLLPNLLYFLAFNTIDRLVNDLKIRITSGKIEALGFIDVSIAWILDLSIVANNLPDGLSSDGDVITIELFKLLGKSSINELITAVDISDINDILRVVMEAVLKDKGDLEMPTVDVGSVLARTNLHRNYSTKALNSSNGTYSRNWFETDKADMFYEIISWVAKAFQNDSFVEQLLALITGSNQTQDTLVDELLLGVKNSGPANFVLGLVELFQPKARAGVNDSSVWANTTYMPAQYTWYGTDSAQNDMENKPISSFLYVAYQNDWTYVKANTFVENADTIISKLLEQQLKEREVNSFGEWLLSLINLAWSNEAITTVMRLLVQLGNATQNELITYIIGRFTANGMDLSEWYNAFGYLFPDVVSEPVQAVDPVTGEPLVDADGDPVYVQKVDENNNPVFDDDGDPVYETAVPDKLIPGHTGYTNVFPNLSAAADPEYEEDLNESGVDRNRNKKYIWTYDGTELELGDRQTFQNALSYMLAGGSGTKGGMMPAIDIFLSGDTGVLFPQTNGTSLLKIYGSNGYDSAIVPFFEALGMNELLKEEDFVGFATSVGLASNQFVHGRFMLRQAEFDSIVTEQLKVEYLFNVAFGFLEKLMTPEIKPAYDDGNNPIYVQATDPETGEPLFDGDNNPVYVQATDPETGEPLFDADNNPVYVQATVKVYNKLVKDILTTVLPAGLYFLQSNGLSVFVRNLLQPVLTLVDALLPIVNINVDPTNSLDKLLNELIGRFVLPLIGKAGDRQIAKDTNGNYLYETDSNGEPLKDADGNVLYIYDDDYGVSLKDLSLHAIAGIVEKLLGLNMEPFVYGLDAICSTVVGRSDFKDSASEMSTDAFWTTSGARNGFKKPVFLNGAYYSIATDPETGFSTVTGSPSNVNDPANVVTILLSLVLDLALEEHSKSPKRTPVTDDEGKPVYIVDQNGNTTTMLQYTYEGGVYTNAEAIVNLIKLFTDAELVNLIPMVISAVRDLGFTAAWTITPNWSYFDDIDRAEYDPETGELIRTNRRTTAQLIAEATAMQESTGFPMINTPVRTIYYLRYAENFAPSTNLWSRELATYLDTSLSDLVDWIMADFVVKEEGATLGSYVENLLTGEGGLIKKGIINTINGALRDGLGGAVAKFAELLNIFISFDVHYWDNDPYTADEEDDPLSLTAFGEALGRLLTPFNEILTWLLAGTNIAMFHSYRTTGGYTEWVMDADNRPADYGDVKDLLTLPGGQGYWVVLVPLLETLGIQLPRTADNTGYKYQRESEGVNAGRIYYMNEGSKVYASGCEILTDVVVTVLSQVEGWMRGEDPLGLGDNLIDCVLNRLANIFYFLNANGLVSLVVNLLSPLLPLANAIVPMIFADLGVPEQGVDEDAAAYETRKFIVLIDELLDELLYTEKTVTQINSETGEEEEITEKIPILPESFSILDLNLYNIFEVIKDITGLDINGAVTANFYINGENEDDGVEYSYNYLKNFFLGEISMRTSANGDMYFRMDFNDEESRADFITILIYTVMDVLNSAMTPGTSNNEFFVSILGKTDEKDEEGNAIIDEELGQQKLTDLYNIIHARVSGYEGYDWFYFDKQAREAYYAHTPETEYSATLQIKLQSILEQLASGGYQVDWNDTTMAYLLTGYLNYTDTNLWDENTARMVEARFNEIIDLVIKAVAKDDNATVGSYLTGLLEGLNLYSNTYIVLLGSLLGNLLSGIPENVVELLNAAVPGFDATYWNRYAGKAVEDENHPAGTVEYDEETGEVKTEYVELVVYDSKEEFVNEFVSLFEPFGYLLDWLLVGEHKGLDLFYVVDGVKNDTPAISIGGANGFKEGLVPLLEALGLKFNAADVNDPDLTGIECVKLTLNSLLNWVDALLTAEDADGNNNTVGAFVDLLPNIIYFINANGLTVTVLNTLRSLTNILELASGMLKTSAGDITNLNTLLGLDKKGINLYDLSLEGICNIVLGLTATDEYDGLDIIKSVSIPEPYEEIVTDDEGNPVLDDETGEPLTVTKYRYNSYLQQWAIGKVTINTESALYVSGGDDARNMYRMDFTYTREEIAAFGADWGDISKEERARRMERINIFTVLVCSVLDVFKEESNQGFLRDKLGQYYDLIASILNVTAGEINYQPYDWFYFSDEIDVTNAEIHNDVTNKGPFFPEDGSTYVVKYLDTTPYSLIYKYGYFEYYRHEAGDTGNLWNKNSVGYLKDNFYNLIDTVIQLVTKYDPEASPQVGYAGAGELIADKWNGLNLYSKKNLYTVGAAVGNLLGGFGDVLELALNIVLGVDIHGNWDEYIYNKIADDDHPAGTTETDEAGHTITYIADERMNRTEFINALVDIFSPADFLISWFLVGADTPLEFMYTKTGEAAIKLNGGNGYDEALVPILEALGCDLTDSAAYFAAAAGGKSGINVVKYVADKLLGRVDAIAASANPVQEIVAMLPELIYFINANGLSVSVQNFIAPIVSLLGVVNSFVDTGEIGEIETVDDLLAFAMSMLQDQISVDFDLTAISISDLTITGVFNLLKAILGVDINAAVTFPQMTNDENGNTVPVTPTKLINIYKQLAIGKVTRYTSANGRTAYRMDACDDDAALSQIDMIAILMATIVNMFEAKNEDSTYVNEAAFVNLFNGFGSAENPVDGQAIFDAIINILNLENGSYVDYDWLFTLRTSDKHLPYLDPMYQNTYVSPIDKVSTITGTAGYDRYWTKEMAQYVADNLVKVVNNVLLLIGISIPGIDGPIESIDDLINGFIPGGNLYTNELLGKLITLIVGTGETDDEGKLDKGLLGKLDEIDPQGAIRGLLRDLLGIDLGIMEAYRGRTNYGFTDGDRDGFVAALAQFLSPVNPLLEWLFTDKSISLFYNYDASDLIKLPGGNGYEQAVIPLFEAVIGYQNPNIKTLAQYKADIAANPNAILIDILNPLLDFVDAALQDPLNVILGRIPAIVYFINSKAADRMVKNLLSPVYQVLNALNTLVEIDIDSIIKDAIGFSLEELDFNAIIEVVIGLLPDNLSSLSPLIIDAVKELTIGKVIQYPSKARFYTDLGAMYTYGFTMELDNVSSSSGGVTVNGSQNATLADLITILLRALIKWLTMPENQETVVNFLNENIENEQVRTYVLNAYGVDETTLGAIDTGLIGFRYQPYGVSQMMAVLYYVYFAANFASSAAISAVQKYGNYWPYVSSTLTSLVASNSALSFLTGFITYLDGLVQRVNGQSGDNGGNGNTTPPETEDTDGGQGGSITDIINPGNNGGDNGGNGGNGGNNGGGSMNFFQKIMKWFQDLFDRIRRFFTFG